MKRSTFGISLAFAAAIGCAACCVGDKNAVFAEAGGQKCQQAAAVSGLSNAYKPIIERYGSLMGQTADSNFEEDAISEVVINFPEAVKASQMGYALCDLNGDGSPELLVGETLNQEKVLHVIVDAYTLKRSQAVRLFSSKARNRHYYAFDKQNNEPLIVSEWSNGAAHSGYNSYTLTPDKTFVCIDSVFCLNDQWYQSSQDGSLLETAGSESEAISSDFANELINYYASMYSSLNFQPFPKAAAAVGQPSVKSTAAVAPSSSSAYKLPDAKLSANYLKNIKSEMTSFTKFDADKGEYAVEVVISVDRPVKNFKLLRLELTNVSPEGQPSFSTKEIYHQADLIPHHPFIVKMNLPETVPNYAISYTEANGTFKKYAIGLSGQDGSIVLEKL
ncbi:MAG: hypothetical protein ACI376_00030 [Candidatus Bruticola sp.]